MSCPKSLTQHLRDVDTGQLYSSANRLLHAIEECNLICALQSELGEQRSAASISLESASCRFMEHACGFTQFEQAVSESAAIDILWSPSYWFDLSTGTEVEQREKKSICLEKLTEGLSFLRRISLLVESDAKRLNLENDNAGIVLRLVDATETASDPDRIARLIDGVDLIYRACARLAGRSEDGLHVMRVAGSNARTVAFRGHAEPATACRRIIYAASDIAAHCIEHEHFSADEVADSNPFMQSLDDLFRIGALSADDAEDIRAGVLSGSIMVLESGALLCGVDADTFAYPEHSTSVPLTNCVESAQIDLDGDLY